MIVTEKNHLAFLNRELWDLFNQVVWFILISLVHRKHKRIKPLVWITFNDEHYLINIFVLVPISLHWCTFPSVADGAAVHVHRNNTQEIVIGLELYIYLPAFYIYRHKKYIQNEPLSYLQCSQCVFTGDCCAKTVITECHLFI